MICALCPLAGLASVNNPGTTQDAERGWLSDASSSEASSNDTLGSLVQRALQRVAHNEHDHKRKRNRLGTHSYRVHASSTALAPQSPPHREVSVAAPRSVPAAYQRTPAPWFVSQRQAPLPADPVRQLRHLLLLDPALPIKVWPAHISSETVDALQLTQMMACADGAHLGHEKPAPPPRPARNGTAYAQHDGRR